MTPEQFAYWFRGFLEVTRAGLEEGQKLTLTDKQIDMIDKHLASVFTQTIMTQPVVTTPYIPEISPVAPGYPIPWPSPYEDSSGTVPKYPLPEPPYRVTCGGGSTVECGKSIVSKADLGPGAIIC